jgi:hypothetical protein
VLTGVNKFKKSVRANLEAREGTPIDEKPSRKN